MFKTKIKATVKGEIRDRRVSLLIAVDHLWHKTAHIPVYLLEFRINSRWLFPRIIFARHHATRGLHLFTCRPPAAAPAHPQERPLLHANPVTIPELVLPTSPSPIPLPTANVNSVRLLPFSLYPFCDANSQTMDMDGYVANAAAGLGYMLQDLPSYFCKQWPNKLLLLKS